MTLNGTLNGARLTNAMPRSIGAITRVEIERSCEATVLALPWTYDFGIVLPASGMESGEAIPPANVTGAQIGFLEVGRRAFPGFSFRGPFGTCLYEGPLPLLFAINRGRWEPLEIEPLTTFGLVRGLCERRITLVGAFNPPEPAQRLNFT
jgi:hypothetical protein